MRHLLLALLATALTGCLDFTAAKTRCFDAGWCSNGPADLPYVVTHTPKSNAMQVSATDAIVLVFSRPIADATLDVSLVPADMLSPPQWDEDRLTATLLPVSPLRFATLYTVQLRDAVSSDDGQVMAPDSFTFTTRDAPDMSAPTLVSTVPVNQMGNVPLTSGLLLVFSEAMNKDSLHVQSTPEIDWGTATWSAQDKNATFAPTDAGLSPETTYAVSVEAEDVSGNALGGNPTIIFTTAKAPDTTKPVVLSVSPPAASTGISPTVSPAFNFSEGMQASTVSAFSITPDAGAMNCVLDPGGTLMTCTHPGGPLAGNAAYTLRLAAAQAKDLAGNPLEADFTSTFTTSLVPDTMAPTIMSVSPTNAAAGQSYYPVISVTFSEAMDKAATQAAISVTSPAMAGTGTFTWDPNGKTVTFNPTDPTGGYNPGTTFSWQVANTAKDLAGNPLGGSTQLYSFKVRLRTTVPVYSSASDGYVYQLSSNARTAVPTGTVALIGENSGNTKYRAFLFFDLASALPANALGIESARLYVYQRVGLGNPYTNGFGNLIGEHIAYAASLSASMWTAAAIPGQSRYLCYPTACPAPTAFTVATSSSSGWVSPYVDDFLTDVFSTKKMLVRLRFATKDGDNDGVGEYVSVDMSEGSFRPHLDVTYEYP